MEFYGIGDALRIKVKKLHVTISDSVWKHQTKTGIWEVWETFRPLRGFFSLRLNLQSVFSLQSQTEEAPERAKRLSNFPYSRLCLMVWKKFFPLLTLSENTGEDALAMGIVSQTKHVYRAWQVCCEPDSTASWYLYVFEQLLVKVEGSNATVHLFVFVQAWCWKADISALTPTLVFNHQVSASRTDEELLHLKRHLTMIDLRAAAFETSSDHDWSTFCWSWGPAPPLDFGLV